MEHNNSEMPMLDLISIVALAVMFTLGCLYVAGCERLKDARS